MKNRRTVCRAAIAFSHSAKSNDPEPIEQSHDLISWIDLIPLLSEIRITRILVVVILHQLSASDKIYWQGVVRVITVVEILITVFVAAPIDDRSMDRTHQKMNGKERIHPPVRRKEIVEQEIQHTECDANAPSVAETIKAAPSRRSASELEFEMQRPGHKAIIDLLGIHHQAPNILEELR
jgi:hypothetical protein